jgi:hypothetical protein
MRKHPMKKIILASVGSVLLLTLLFPSVAAMTGSEVDVWGTISALFAKVNTQEEKIIKLEHRIDELLDQLEQTKKPPEVIEKPDPEKPKEEPPVEIKPEEPKPTEPKPVEPKPAAELVVTVKSVDSGLKILWTASTRDDLKGVKIVLSKSDPNPSYPDDGYLVWITDPKVTSTLIKVGQSYHGGDVGDTVKADTRYYVSVTYVFDQENITTKAVTAKIPQTVTQPKPPLDPSTLKIMVKVIEDGVKIAWTPESSAKLLGYKVVISETNPTPSYPDDGYLTWITNPSTAYWVIRKGDAVNGGDVDGPLKANTTYYAAITYIYSTGSVTTPAVAFVAPASFDESEDDVPLDPTTLALDVQIVEDALKLSWTYEPSTSLKGYKIVISASNTTPSYPDDGYLTWITDPTTTTFIVDNSLYYQGGDIEGFLKPDTTYTLAITYVYVDCKVTTPPITITTPSNFRITY